MNVDPRGVKRGNCIEVNCDCSIYEYEEKNGPKCNYCFCPPSKHLKIDATAENSAGEIISTCSENSDLPGPTGYVVQELVPVSLSPEVASPLQNLLPKKLPKQVEIALENKSLTPLLRNKIVRVIADKCFEESISSRTVNIVADLAVQKWSPLKSKFGDSSASLAIQIKKRMTKLRMHSKKINDPDETKESRESHTYNQQEMVLEMGKKSFSILKLKQFLDGTRTIRKTEVNATPALKIIQLYPALKIPDLLLWEFTKITNVSEDILFQRWEDFINRMKSYLVRTENFSPLDESQESLTVEILTKLPSLLPSGKRTADNTKLVVQIFEENTVISDTVPPRSDPPRLIAIGDSSKNITFYCYVDGMAMFTEKCPMKAVLLLLSTYWVFNIQFAAEARPSFVLLSMAVLRDEMPKGNTSKCSGAVDCLLKQLQL